MDGSVETQRIDFSDGDVDLVSMMDIPKVCTMPAEPAPVVEKVVRRRE